MATDKIKLSNNLKQTTETDKICLKDKDNVQVKLTMKIKGKEFETSAIHLYIKRNPQTGRTIKK